MTAPRDPAVDAAQRAWVDRDAVENDLHRHQPILSIKDGSIAGCQCMDRVFYRGHEDWGSHLAEVCGDHMEAAAREALAPIKELHRPLDRSNLPYSVDNRVVCNHCLGPIDWPCPTSLLIYSSDELTGGDT